MWLRPPVLAFGGREVIVGFLCGHWEGGRVRDGLIDGENNGGRSHHGGHGGGSWWCSGGVLGCEAR
jgi:hypothetical protein